MQLFQVAVQAVHLRRFQHLAGVVQPGQKLLDTWQLLSQVFRALGVQRQLQRAAFLTQQVTQPAGQLRLALAFAAALALSGPGPGHQPA
ncbi:hypothetical protein D9M71_334030 [compost metagenome]